MKNNNFREIQVSSSLLVVIFLGVLALGVFIFLLGVSVGKKQVRLSAPTQAAGPLYYVQVGAFTDRAQAQTAAETYRKQGLTVFVTDPKPTDTRTWYRVRLGGYASRDSAVGLLDQLNAA